MYYVDFIDSICKVILINIMVQESGIMFNRPSVVGAVLQSPMLLIIFFYLFIFPQKPLGGGEDNDENNSMGEDNFFF